jgi:hypothetical protein
VPLLLCPPFFPMFLFANRDDQHLLSHALASDFTVTWQCLSKRTIGFSLRIKLHTLNASFKSSIKHFICKKAQYWDIFLTFLAVFPNMNLCHRRMLFWKNDKLIFVFKFRPLACSCEVKALFPVSIVYSNHRNLRTM